MTITGHGSRKTRCDDRISQWIRVRDRPVPLPSGDAWSQVAPPFQAHKGRRSADPRVTLDAVLHKARVGCAWSDPPSPPGNLSSRHSRAVLAPYKRLRRIEFGPLPKTVSGKIRRIELREATAAGSDAEYREEDFR